METKRLNQKSVFRVGIWALVIAYFLFIVYINLSHKIFYAGSADFYADIMYAKTAWEQKSIFPKGWIFGNQFYVVATPVLAALFYGLTDDLCIAMGVASTVMAAWTLLSFAWMLRAITRTTDGIPGGYISLFVTHAFMR